MILWGPPGCGKTTFARLLAEQTRSEFIQLQAVSAGVRDVREVIEKARVRRNTGRRTILFIDEIHRFNKAQQDALLHSVEDGLVTLIGATTENPSFEVIAPLLSRARVYVFQPLTEEHLGRIVAHALATDEALAAHRVDLTGTPDLLRLAAGDARMALNALETAIALAERGPDGAAVVGREEIEQAFQRRASRYDRAGEEHYNIISAFIKSMRGSDPDGAVYWLARMLEGGEDPLFIARRMIILASEDIGNADPYALTLAASCFQAVHAVGLPEGRIILAQTCAYLASCPKSNAAYTAIEEAAADAARLPDLPVPLHIRNAPTGLMKDLGYGREYRYAHDVPGNFTEQHYLPDEFRGKLYYRPTDNGAEKKIRERLNGWWASRRR
jgi:putative ATPase